MEFLQKVTDIAERPFVALMGGAKIAGKIEPLEALVKLADKVLIGGGMANTFLAARGVPMGGSLVDKDSIEVAQRIMRERRTRGAGELVLPVDLDRRGLAGQPDGDRRRGVSDGLTRTTRRHSTSARRRSRRTSRAQAKRS